MQYQINYRFKKQTGGSREIILLSNSNSSHRMIFDTKEKQLELKNILNQYKDIPPRIQVLFSQLITDIMLDSLNDVNIKMIDNDAYNFIKTQILQIEQIKKYKFIFSKIKINNNIENLIVKKGYNISKILHFDDTYYISTNSQKAVEKIKELQEYFYDDINKIIETYNKEYDITQMLFEKFKKYILDIDVYYNEQLKIKNYITYLGEIHDMKIIQFNKNEYLYKTFKSSIKNDIVTLQNIVKLCEYIENCNKIYFLKKYKDEYEYSVQIAKVPKIIFIDDDEIDFNQMHIDFLMDIPNGLTCKQIQENYSSYWIQTKNLIKSAINKLFDELTAKSFLIKDFAYDDIMWDMPTNTLTYININPDSFDTHYTISKIKSDNQQLLQRLLQKSII